MNSLNPAAAPSILITDNAEIAELFNDFKYSDQSTNSYNSLSKIVGTIKENFPESSLFLTNQNTGFNSLNVECLLDSYPKAEISLLETSEIFELKILRSATANIIAQKNAAGLNGVVFGPTQTFFIAFGIGDDLDYWSPFSCYFLNGAESYDSFDEARTINLTFAAGFGLGDMSSSRIRNFVNLELVESGQISTFDQFKLKSDDPSDSTPNKREDTTNSFIKARRKYRFNNYPFYIASLDNLIEKTLQVIFNTDNVLVINYSPPYKLIEKFIAEQNNAGKINLEVEFEKLRKLSEPPPADSPQVRRLRGFYKVLEDISTYFNINVAPEWPNPEKVYTIPSEAAKGDEIAMIKNIKTLGYSLNTDKNTGKTKDVINSILKKFISGYNQLLATNSYCYTRETDLNVLKQADESIKKDFGESFFEKNKPLIIFGPKELVANYFYGQKYTINYPSDFAKTPENVEKNIDIRLRTVHNLYNSQNAENTSLANLLLEREETKAKLQNFLQTKNYPIFKYNIQNSNVLSLKITDNQAYFLLLNQTYNILGNYASIKTTSLKDPTAEATESNEEKLIKEKINEVLYEPGLGRSGPIFPEDTYPGDKVDSAVSELREQLKRAKELAFAYKLSKSTDEDKLDIIIKEGKDAAHIDSIIINTFFGKPQPGSPELAKIKETLYDDNISNDRKLELLRGDEGLNNAYLDQEAQIFIDYQKQKYGLIADVEDAYATDPFKFFNDQLEVLDKMLFQIEIETLPFFGISNFAFLYSPCLLFAQRPGLIGDNKTRNTLDSISGPYNILGYRHEINSSRVSSTFKLFSVPK